MTINDMTIDDSENIEIGLLLEAIFRKYGYDFRNYAGAHLKRRLRNFFTLSGLKSFSEIQHRILNDIVFFNDLLAELSINVTEMFRDPSFFTAVRREVLPLLRTYPFIKIWHAGCATGQEVYSMAILLLEEGLYDRTQIYATDFSEAALRTAKDGIIPINCIRKYTENYQKSGGRSSFADYYTAHYDAAILDSSLRQKIVFANHNLSTDSIFGEMQMIVCRNVLIYFNQQLQGRVINLFHDSLCPGGILCLGTKESLQYTPCSNRFKPLTAGEKIFQKAYSINDSDNILQKQPNVADAAGTAGHS